MNALLKNGRLKLSTPVQQVYFIDFHWSHVIKISWKFTLLSKFEKQWLKRVHKLVGFLPTLTMHSSILLQTTMIKNVLACRQNFWLMKHTSIILLVTRRGTLLMESGLLHDYFGNFSTWGERYYFCMEGAHQVKLNPWEVRLEQTLENFETRWRGY